MSRHGDGNDRIEETEFHDFVQRSMLQSRKREDRSKARTKQKKPLETSEGKPADKNKSERRLQRRPLYDY